MRYKEVIEAFVHMHWRAAPRSASSGNYKAVRDEQGRPHLLLFRNEIAWYDEDALATSDCGWATRTSRKAINYVKYMDAVIRRRNQQWSMFNEDT